MKGNDLVSVGTRTPCESTCTRGTVAGTFTHLDSVSSVWVGGPLELVTQSHQKNEVPFLGVL